MGSAAVACQYECYKESGALLALRSEGNLELCMPIDRWIEYMAQHHESWYQWAKIFCDGGIGHKEIVLVHGWIKTKDWYLASFSRKDTALQLALSGETPYGEVHAAIGFQTKYITSPERRKSRHFSSNLVNEGRHAPSGSNQEPPRDCVFIVGLRIKTRHLFLQKLFGMAGDLRISSDGPNLPPEDRPHEGMANPTSENETGTRGGTSQAGIGGPTDTDAEVNEPTTMDSYENEDHEVILFVVIS